MVIHGIRDMSIYQENKIFVNKYKKELEKCFKSDKDAKFRYKVFLNSPDLKSIVLYVYIKIEDIFIVEANKKLYFCVSPKIVSRDVATDFNANSKSTEDLAIVAYTDTLSPYDISEYDLNDLKKYLKSKGVTTVWKKPIDDADRHDTVWEVKDHPDWLKGYSKIKSIEGIVKKLQECQIDVYRHPDIFKSIKEENLIPVSFIDFSKSGYESLSYPYRRASSRKSTSFYRNMSLAAALPDLRDIAESTTIRTPFQMWLCCDIKSDVVNEKATYSYNWEN